MSMPEAGRLGSREAERPDPNHLMEKKLTQPFDALIEGRRSIRKYKDHMPSDAWIKRMIHCAAQAPSPSNSQPVRFLEIRSRKKKQDLFEAMTLGKRHFLQVIQETEKPKRMRNYVNTYYRYSEFMFKAPLLFGVGTVRPNTGFSARLYNAGLIQHLDQKEPDISVGLALKGFILKGQDLGLGSCILTAPLVFISNVEEILEVKDVNIRCFITVGFPDEVPAAVEKMTVAEIYRKV